MFRQLLEVVYFGNVDVLLVTGDVRLNIFKEATFLYASDFYYSVIYP